MSGMPTLNTSSEDKCKVIQGQEFGIRRILALVNLQNPCPQRHLNCNFSYLNAQMEEINKLRNSLMTLPYSSGGVPKRLMQGQLPPPICALSICALGLPA